MATAFYLKNLKLTNFEKLKLQPPKIPDFNLQGGENGRDKLAKPTFKV